MIHPHPAVPFVLRRLRLAWILSNLGLPQWDNIDGIAAEALAAGMDADPLASLASLSQPIEDSLAMSLLDELAATLNWKKLQKYEALFAIAHYCAEEAVSSRVDAIEACNFMYETIYLRLEQEGRMEIAEKIQPFVEISISWAENSDTLKSISSPANFRDRMVSNALLLFQAFLDANSVTNTYRSE